MALTTNRYNADDGIGNTKKRKEEEEKQAQTLGYGAVNMPQYQTYTPTAFSGYQTYADNPYGGYKDFSYNPFSYKEFSYDYKTDPLYQMYSEQYTQKGQQAMDDTMAKVSARTGGVASSYAQAASQNAYNSYMAELAAKIPELQQIARGMYDTDRNFAYDQYQDEKNTAYNNYLRGYNEDYANWQNTNAINQANVDLANQYAYANWQAQENARQQAVNNANDWAMAKWKNDQSIANSNYDLYLQNAANATADVSDTSFDGLLAEWVVKTNGNQNEFERMLSDAVKDGTINEDEADAYRNMYRRNPMVTARQYLSGRNSITDQLQ